MEQLSVSKQIIEKKTGQSCSWFCYPNGTVDDFNGHTNQELIERGYSCGIIAVPGLNNDFSSVMELKRVGPSADMAEFKVTLSGIGVLLAWCKRSLASGLRVQSQVSDGYSE